MEKAKKCPSSTIQEGAIILGYLNEQGTITFMQRKVEADAAFIEAAYKNGPPEANFRFSHTCVEGNCKQWTGKSCSVITSLLKLNELPADENGLPLCSIRKDCRWFTQEGENACKICPLVVTDVSL